jgi:hypothetical protein
MIANFDLESIKQVSSAEYRAARFALLKMRVRRSIEQTDAAAEEVEDALAHFAENLDGRQSIERYWC